MLLVPSVVIFVRHAKDCPSANQGESFHGCKCRKHLRWNHEGRQFRHATKTRSWEQAEKIKRQVEARYSGNVMVGSMPDKPAPKQTTIARAIELFIMDKNENQGL